MKVVWALLAAAVIAWLSSLVITWIAAGVLALGTGAALFWGWEHHLDREARRRRFEPDANGNYPQPDPRYAGLSSDAYEAAVLTMIRNTSYAQVVRADASRQAVHTYSPSWEHEEVLPRGGSAPALLSAPAPAAAPPATVPTFRALLQQQRIGQHELLLGYRADTYAPITGAWPAISTSAIGGRSQTGKTTTTRWLLAQSALQGTRFVVCDPHGNAAPQAGHKTLAQTIRPLAAAFVCDIAIDPLTIKRCADLVEHELDRRLQGQAWQHPLLWIVDEFSYLARVADRVAQRVAYVMERVAAEGSKLEVSGLVLVQQGHGSRFGGTELRSVLQSAYLHQMEPRMAQMITGLRSVDVPDIAKLPPGHAYLYTAAGALEKVIVPDTRPDDLEYVGQLLRGYPTATPRLQPAAGMTTMAATPVADRSQIMPTAMTPAPPQAVAAAQLFMQGRDPAEIVWAMRQIKSSEGGRYQAALKATLADIRAGLRSVHENS